MVYRTKQLSVIPPGGRTYFCMPSQWFWSAPAGDFIPLCGLKCFKLKALGICLSMARNFKMATFSNLSWQIIQEILFGQQGLLICNSKLQIVYDLWPNKYKPFHIVLYCCPDFLFVFIISGCMRLKKKSTVAKDTVLLYAFQDWDMPYYGSSINFLVGSIQYSGEATLQVKDD